MQIHRLRLVNFRQHEDTELSLGAGLTGIIGPNGAGKSTLLEAIAFAIYGTPAARGTRESIRRRGAPPPPALPHPAGPRPAALTAGPGPARAVHCA